MKRIQMYFHRYALKPYHRIISYYYATGKNPKGWRS